MGGVAEAVDMVGRIEVDRDFIPQDVLDVENRASTSLYPWKGQFSPGLVSAFIEAYARKDDVLLDPFAGSGTVLYEAARSRHACYGVEINPAALELASMVRFSPLSRAQRLAVLSEADDLVKKHFSGFTPADLFDSSPQADGNASPEEALKRMLEEADGSPLLASFLTTAAMLAMGDSNSVDPEKIVASYRRNGLKVLEIPESNKNLEVFATDARSIPLDNDSVDLVITSPPYINVFNYHQNYRKAMELMGRRPLQVATSEIGSNRKHRYNRFFTVIQYCLDLLEVLHEIKRLLKRDGTAVFVIGRESTVRGARFKNGELLAQVAVAEGGFSVSRWQERRFTNRYGQSIYEDIITLKPSTTDGLPNRDVARKIGILALKRATGESLDADVLANIKDAINNGDKVNPSPVLTPSLADGTNGAGAPTMGKGAVTPSPGIRRQH